MKNLQVEYFEQDVEIQQPQTTKRLPHFQCKFCLQTFHQVSLLIQHQRNIHRSRFGCARCNQTFRNEYVLRIHLRKDSCSKLIFDPPVSICLPSSPSPDLQTMQPLQQVKQEVGQQARNHICRWPGCGKTFTRTSYLSNHMMTHSNDRNYACNVAGCPKRYKTQAHLLNHLSVHRKQEQEQTSSGLLQLQQQGISIKSQPEPVSNIYGCQHSGCDFRATNMVQLQQHISTKHSGSPPTNTAIECPFKCQHCGTSFRKKSSLSNHVKSHSGQFTCAWNGCTFRSHSNVVLSRHMMLHKEGLNISIPDQGNGHGQRSHEIEMDRIKTEPENSEQNRPETFTCKLCDKQFTKRSSIINHVRSHSGQYSCQWPGCYFASQSKMLLRRHVITANHHGDHVQQQEQTSPMNDSDNIVHATSNEEKQPIRIFHCRYPDCSYQTHKRPLYRVHMLKHSEIRKHRCSWPHCGKSFKAKSTLNRHLVRHRQVAFQQQYRNQSSTTLEDQEQENHDNDVDDDNYQPIEPMVIIDSQQQDNKVVESITTETGDNVILFQCKHCPSTFRTKSSLSNHQISHRKPQFRCEKSGCFYETFRSTILERHMRDVHGETKEPEPQVPKYTNAIYQCNQQNCRQQFSTMETLQRHVQTVHQQQNNEQPTTRTYTCFWPDCRMIFSIRAEFQKHLESHQNRTRRRYGCIGWKDCSRTFQTKRGLLAHYIEHRQQQQQQQRNGEQETSKPQRWLRCIWKGCPYTTTMAEQLKKHLNRHRKIQQQKISNQNRLKSSSSPTTQKFIAMPFVASITSTSLPTVSTTTL
ncbi:hypothetical protein BLA29_001773 [Euroglyphus maynei]|uniref:C2H2-type domain-containing protein n=1 Tax=Euroglyphus maynei TaxID=6958 RepID=A0A1Y3BU85_EURMA|nr:hypothetical protein BLA29_001773 [Euroglyphus maynei]